jgi:hypothetical protein
LFDPNAVVLEGSNFAKRKTLYLSNTGSEKLLVDTSFMFAHDAMTVYSLKNKDIVEKWKTGTLAQKNALKEFNFVTRYGSTGSDSRIQRMAQTQSEGDLGSRVLQVSKDC